MILLSFTMDLSFGPAWNMKENLQKNTQYTINSNTTLTDFTYTYFPDMTVWKHV